MAIMQGDLSEYPVPDLLQFIHSSRKPGQLLLESRSAAKPAGVYFADGDVVHAYCPPRQGVHAVYQVLQWTEGRFAFLKNAVPDKRTIFDDLQNLLLEGLRRLDELNLLLRRLPAPEAVLYQAGDAEQSGNIRLTRAEWKILTLVNGRRSCAEILAASGRPDDEAARVIHQLLLAGLVTTYRDDSYLGAVVPGRVPAVLAHSQRVEPSTMLANLILKRIDGRTSLKQVLEELSCSPQQLLEETQLLVRSGWIEVVSGGDEYQRFVRE